MLQKLAVPKMDEWSRFAHNLLEMQTESAEEEAGMTSPLR